MAVEKTLVESKKLKAKPEASYFEERTQEINRWKEHSWNQILTGTKEHFPSKKAKFDQISPVE